MNVGYVHTFEVPENNIDKGRLKVSVVNEENVPIKGAAVRLSYTGNPDNIIGESGTDGDGISIFNDLRTPPIEYSMEPGNRQPFSEYDIAVSAPGFDNVNISGSDMFSGELSIQNVKMSARDNSQNNIVIPVNTLYGDYPPKIDEEEIKPMGQPGEIVLDRVVVPEIVVHYAAGTEKNRCFSLVFGSDYKRAFTEEFGEKQFDFILPYIEGRSEEIFRFVEECVKNFKSFSACERFVR